MHSQSTFVSRVHVGLKLTSSSHCIHRSKSRYNIDTSAMETTPTKSARSDELFSQIGLSPEALPAPKAEPAPKATPASDDDDTSDDEPKPFALVESALVLKGGKCRSNKRSNYLVPILYTENRKTNHKMWRIRTSSWEACNLLTGRPPHVRPLKFAKDVFFQKFRDAVKVTRAANAAAATDGQTPKKSKWARQTAVINIAMRSAGDDMDHEMMVDDSVNYCSVEATVANLDFIAAFYD
jgi:hypothetical protein